MAIPSTGAISLEDVKAEFGGVNPISLNEYYAESKDTIPTGYGIPSAPDAISLSNFRGTQKFSINYIGSINCNAVGTNNGGEVVFDISSRAGNLDRWIVLAAGLADDATDLVSIGGAYTINGNAVTTVFNDGYESDSDGHRVAMVYRKIVNSSNIVTIAWTNPYRVVGGNNVYYKPDRNHAIFAYELTGIPTMGVVNSNLGSGNLTADITLPGSTKRCAILITTTNTTPPPSTMTNATLAGNIERHSSWYDTNMGNGTIVYTTDSVNYGAFGGASFPY